MKIVVTGATGFLGRPLCAELIGQGHTVTALSRDADRARSVLGPTVSCVAWEGAKDELQWMAAVAAADTVVHLAGQSVAEKAWTPAIKEALRRSRIDTSRRLVDAMRSSDSGRPAALVCASGINYFGDRGDELLTEESPPGSTFLSQLCIDWEAEARKAEALGVRVALLRPGIALEHGGPLDKLLFPLPVPISPWALGLGGPIGNGRQWLPWIHRDDAVGLFVWAVTNTAVSGPVNTVAPQLVRNVEFSRALGRVLHRPAILPIPGFALKALIGGFADELLTSQRAEPKAALTLGYTYRYPEIEAALTAILSKGLR